MNIVVTMSVGGAVHCDTPSSGIGGDVERWRQRALTSMFATDDWTPLRRFICQGRASSLVLVIGEHRIDDTEHVFMHPRAALGGEDLITIPLGSEGKERQHQLAVQVHLPAAIDDCRDRERYTAGYV